MNLIEKREEFCLQFDTYSKYWYQINAIIEQYKRESVDAIGYIVLTEDNEMRMNFYPKAIKEGLVGIGDKLYTSPQQSNTALISELATAVDEIERLKSQQDRLLNTDTLAEIIRKVDGNHNLGAGELAERIIKELEKANDHAKRV